MTGQLRSCITPALGELPGHSFDNSGESTAAARSTFFCALARIDSSFPRHSQWIAAANCPPNTSLQQSSRATCSGSLQSSVANAVEQESAPAFAGNGAAGQIQGCAGVVTITTKARDRLRELKTRQHGSQVAKAKEAGFFLRLGVKSGGCSGLSYVLDIIDKTAVAPTDFKEEFKQEDGESAADSIMVVIDPKSLLYVVGTVLDYSDDLIGGGFRTSSLNYSHISVAECNAGTTVLNPNASRSCGCGMSFGVPRTFSKGVIDSKPKSCSSAAKGRGDPPVGTRITT